MAISLVFNHVSCHISNSNAKTIEKQFTSFITFPKGCNKYSYLPKTNNSFSPACLVPENIQRIIVICRHGQIQMYKFHCANTQWHSIVSTFGLCQYCLFALCHTVVCRWRPTNEFAVWSRPPDVGWLPLNPGVDKDHSHSGLKTISLPNLFASSTSSTLDQSEIEDMRLTSGL